ncbi:flagellinolysin [Bacillus sp. AK128]
MIINNNISAMNAYRFNFQNNKNVAHSMEKLSSGLRINRAGDDAAGLAISEKMRGQIRGLQQANRNAQDSISLIQTAEGGLSEVHALIQRGRELSVQAANGSLTATDRKSVQNEIDQIVDEVDRIANNTEFNTIKLLNKDSYEGTTDQEKVIAGLKKSWLRESEKMIEDLYGLKGNGESITLDLTYTDGPDNVLAQANNTVIKIDMADFTPSTKDNAGGILYDRVIAHEMVHSVMASDIGFSGLPYWFIEGTAEFIHGADERLKADIQNEGSTSALLTSHALGNSIDEAGPSAEYYSVAYAATRYLHENASGGIKGVLEDLKNGSTFDQAISNRTSFASLTGFEADFNTNGANFIETEMNLDNDDTGAIGGLDADGGAEKTAQSVVGDTENYEDNPLKNFNIIWPNGEADYKGLTFQLGANSGQAMTLLFSSSTSESLGIDQTDVVAGAEQAISSFNSAIETVSAKRSYLGALQNRLDHAISANEINFENLQASESRIRDVDLASEMLKFTKNNILQQASQSMLAQANQKPQTVLQLLG